MWNLFRIEKEHYYFLEGVFEKIEEAYILADKLKAQGFKYVIMRKIF